MGFDAWVLPCRKLAERRVKNVTILEIAGEKRLAIQYHERKHQELVQFIVQRSS